MSKFSPHSTPHIPRPTRRSGFTIVELLVVLGISAMLSGLAIVYSNIARNRTTLVIETAKIAQFILQAKQLSLATYTGTSASCGYGAAFDLSASLQTYSIFAYSPAGAPPCPAARTITAIAAGDEKQHSPGTWRVPISRGVVLQPQGDSLAAVLFYPPDPAVFLSRDGSTFPSPAATLKIHLATADGQNSATISVNPAGQVTF